MSIYDRPNVHLYNQLLQKDYKDLTEQEKWYMKKMYQLEEIKSERG